MRATPSERGYVRLGDSDRESCGASRAPRSVPGRALRTAPRSPSPRGTLLFGGEMRVMGRGTLRAGRAGTGGPQLPPGLHWPVPNRSVPSAGYGDLEPIIPEGLSLHPAAPGAFPPLDEATAAADAALAPPMEKASREGSRCDPEAIASTPCLRSLCFLGRSPSGAAKLPPADRISGRRERTLIRCACVAITLATIAVLTPPTFRYFFVVVFPPSPPPPPPSPPSPPASPSPPSPPPSPPSPPPPSPPPPLSCTVRCAHRSTCRSHITSFSRTLS